MVTDLYSGLLQREKIKRMNQILAGLILSVAVMGSLPMLAAGPAPVDLGSAAHFAILAGAAITSTGGGTINGDVGASPIAGSAIGITTTQVNGVIYAVDGSGPAGSVVDSNLLTTAMADLVTSYNDAAGRTNPLAVDPGGANLGGLNLIPGLYKFTSAALISGGDVTLTGGPNDVWIFQIGTALTVGSGMHVILAGGAQARNIFWQVATAVTIGTSAMFKGTIMASQEAITMDASSTLEGRALASVAAVTFNGQRIALPATLSGAIGNRVWLDENGDGLQDAGEVGIANVGLVLLNTNGVALATNVTGVNGGYLFTDLLPGAYVVRVETISLAAGLAANQTLDPDATTDHETSVTLTAGQKVMTADFGYNWASINDVMNNTGTGAIGDRLWIDANGDGVQDPDEPGLGGVSVTLVNLGADGILGTVDDTTNTTTTAADGSYIFDGLAAGAFQVAVNGGTAPVGYAAKGDPDGVLDNKTTTPILLTPGDVYVNADFGYQPGSGSTIGDLVYFDTNADGTNSVGDYGLAGVTVSLLNNSGAVMATTVTATNGLYQFTGIPAGNYTVWVSDTYGVLTLLRSSGDPDGAGNLDERSTLPVDGTSSYMDRDFGYKALEQTPATSLIEGTIYLDRNANSMVDAGEGLQGVSVWLSDTNGWQLAAMLTDLNGQYYFSGLAAGTYVVAVATNSLPGTPGQLTNMQDPDFGAANQATLTVTAGQIDLAQDFGYQDLTAPNAVTGKVWVDASANGTLDADESNRYAGVTVALLDTNGNVVATTVTDTTGNYTFSGLPDGTFTVDVTDIAQILNGVWHSLGANSQNDPFTVTLTGSRTEIVAFGYYKAGAALGNLVWFDTDKNGVQNPGETNLVNIRVVLRVVYSNGVTNVVTMLTDTNGYYGFGNLLLDENHDGVAPGGPVYTLSVVMPGNKVGQTILGATNVWLDSDNVMGTVAVPVKGLTNVGALANPGNEPMAASYDFGLYWQPTLARLTGVRAFSRDGQVVVSWESAEELNTAGFYLERLGNEGYQRVNEDLIPSFEMGGGIYEQVDSAVRAGGTYTYRLIELETSGNQLYLGPYVMTVDGTALSFDEWSRAMFETKDLFNPQASGENADPDGDGMSNLAEFQSGTRPLDSNSSLRIRAFARSSGDGFNVRWLSESNRFYTIERSTNLLEGFATVTNGILATPHENQLFDAIQSALGAVFYRIRLE